jgi:hypothetical protein
MAMKTQAWGWLTAGVLALGLNGVYQDGGAAWAHRQMDGVMARISDRSQAVLALATGRVDWFMAKANVAATRNETTSCSVATAVARFQTRMARTQTGLAQFEAISGREEAARARMEANRGRIEAQVARARFMPADFKMVTIPAVCPRVQVRIPRMSVPRPMVRVPEVHVAAMGAGPV